jgi:homoserine kinase
MLITCCPASLGGFYIIEVQPFDIIRIESPSELYATVVHPQIELKNFGCTIRIKTNYFIEKCYYSITVSVGFSSGSYTKDYDLIIFA